MGQEINLLLSEPQPLTAIHRVGGFSCGEPVLDEWLKRRAMANQQSGASRTFVVVDQDHCVRGSHRAMSGKTAASPRGVNSPREVNLTP